MHISPVLPIALLLLGAAGILVLPLSTRLRRWSRWLVLAVTGLAGMLILLSRWARPMVVVLSQWRPAPVFNTLLLLHADAIAHPLALSAVLLMACAACIELTGQHPLRPRLAALMLTLLAVGLAVLWSANVVTLLVSLVLYDLVYALGYLAADGSARAAIRGLFLGILATLCLLAGALLAGNLAITGPWRTVALGNETSLAMWVLAAVLRLSMYPFHLSAPEDFLSPSPLTIPLLLRSLPGWLLWLRMITMNDGSMPALPWVLNLALASAVVGALLAWSSRSHLHALLWSGVGVAGAVLLAGTTAGQDALAIVAAGCITWTLGLGVLFLGRFAVAQTLQWKTPLLIGGWALLGLPGTLGFAVGATLYGSVASVRHILEQAVVGSLLWTVFLTPSLVRYLLSAPSASRIPDAGLQTGGRGLVELGYACGMGLPALLLVVARLFPGVLFDESVLPALAAPPGLTEIAGWWLWVGGLVSGGLLSWGDGWLRARGEAALDTIYDLLHLEWLYEALAGAVNRGLSVLRAADELIGGAGALLWACLIFLLYVLAEGGH